MSVGRGPDGLRGKRTVDGRSRDTSAVPCRLLPVVVGGLLLACAGCSSQDRIRAQAASDFSCDHVEVQRLSHYSYLASGCGRSGQYFFTQGGGEDGAIVGPLELAGNEGPPRAAPVPAPQLLDAPTGAGGFSFGASEDDVRRACEQTGHAYTTSVPGRPSCDGLAAGVGAPARASFDYCASRLCAVSLQVQLAPGENLGRALVRWKAALAAKYGGPTASHPNVPDACFDDVAHCLLGRTRSVRFEWKWPSRQSITLSLQTDAPEPSLSISYAAPDATSSKTPGL